MLAKKAGHPVDRNTGEKITDAARGAFEKATGYEHCLSILTDSGLRGYRYVANDYWTE